MANTLSPLSPSKQNSRSPLGAVSLNTVTRESSPYRPKRDRRSADLDDDALLDDENSILTPKRHGSIKSTLASRQDGSVGNDSHADGDCGSYPAADESLQDPPSSPFQESVHSDRTRDPGGFGTNSDSYRTAPEEDDPPVPAKDMDVYPSVQRPEQDPEELRDMDMGNDETYPGLRDYEYRQSSKVEASSSTFRHQHRTNAHVRGTSPRKVSNMTLENEGMSVVSRRVSNGDGECDTGDDTWLSGFSAVPNADMTQFAKLYDSPAKRLRDSINAKRLSRASILRDSIRLTPGSARRFAAPPGASPIGSPTPRRKYPRIDDDYNLLEFTDQFDTFTQSHRLYGERHEYISPARRERMLPSRRSPGKVDLLDLDIPPAPTPRSIPTITPRELESLRSQFLSEVSSLKATLSGRDAEVASLKEAVANAERRVGEALEEVRNEAARKEALEVQQREWERRGKEMESVLRTVRTEILEGERERDRLLKKAEDAEKAKEQLEGRVVELETQLSAARQAADSGSPRGPSAEMVGQSPADTAKEVQEAVEKVARELHSLYKSKHETKVAALKKSYEARWEKRVREVENKLRDALAEIERLQNERDTLISNANVGETTMLRESEELEAQKCVLEAKVKGLEQELVSVKRDADMLRSELKHERAEKSELVAVVDEWLAMQEEQGEEAAEVETQRPPSSEPPVQKREFDDIEHDERAQSADPGRDDIANSNDTVRGTSSILPAPTQLAASSNVRPRAAPGTTPKVPRFGMPSGHSRSNSGGTMNSGIARLPVPGRSGIMSSIERMGRGGG